jgi:hypothetical protein
MKSKLVLMNVDRCLVCDAEGKTIPLEILPNGGVLYSMNHKNGIVHEWGQIPSMEILFKTEKATPESRRLVCPKCNRRGRINAFIPNPKKPYKFDYVVVHGKIKGTWGKNKLQKRDRCYILDKDQRDIILKKVGRYIDPQSNTGVNK